MIRDIIRLVTLTISLFLISISASAQKEKYSLPYDYSVRLGVSGIPLVHIVNNTASSIHIDPSSQSTSIDRLYRDYTGDKYCTGIISASFDFIFKRWFTLSTGLGICNVFYSKYNSNTGEKIKTEHHLGYDVMAHAKFTWCTTEWVRTYSSIGIGCYFAEETIFPLLQVAPVGVEVGKQVFGFVDLSVGLSHIGGTIGVGYRF